MSQRNYSRGAAVLENYSADKQHSCGSCDKFHLLPSLHLSNSLNPAAADFYLLCRASEANGLPRRSKQDFNLDFLPIWPATALQWVAICQLAKAEVEEFREWDDLFSATELSIWWRWSRWKLRWKSGGGGRDGGEKGGGVG